MQCDNAEQVRHATQRELQEPTDSRPGIQSRGSYDDDVVVVTTGLAEMHGEISRTPRRCLYTFILKKGKRSPYSITERRVPELIPVLGSQPAGDASHKPGGRLPLFPARSAVTLAKLKKAATNFAAW